jgi:protein TonB
MDDLRPPGLSEALNQTPPVPSSSQATPEKEPPPATTAAALPLEHTTPTIQKRSQSKWLIGLVLVLGVVGVGFWSMRPSSQDTAPDPTASQSEPALRLGTDPNTTRPDAEQVAPTTTADVMPLEPIASAALRDAPANGEQTLTAQGAQTPSASQQRTAPILDRKTLQIGPDAYPKESARRGEEGTCRVHVTVGVDGVIQDPAIQESSGSPRLDQACLSAVSKARFQPATVDGTPAKSEAVVPIRWRLAR